MNNKPYENWEDVRKDLKITPEQEEQIKLEEDIIEATINARKENNLTQRDLSKMTGIKQPVIARLERNPTVKTEIAQKRDLFGESVTYGFLGYPVSQAADITTFNGELIPVGEDQLPLIEQCREIVRKFNSIYGDVLTEPEAILSNEKRIKGLDGNEKMGKSLGNAIYLSDTPEVIKEKVMGAVTDKNRIKKDDPGNPDVCMVAYYHNLFSTEEECKTVCEECRSGKRGCVACKKQLAKNINKELEPIREKRKYYEEHPEIVDKILMDGTRKAQNEAKKTMKKVKKAMMLDYFEE